MQELNIEITDNRKSFKPGETIAGTVRWNVQGNPEAIEASLFWRTQGKGTQDVGVVETARFDSPGSLGQKEFSFKLPAGPYSFSGRLISLIWAVEATALPSDETARSEITVSPTGQEVVLRKSSLPG